MTDRLTKGLEAELRAIREMRARSDTMTDLTDAELDALEAGHKARWHGMFMQPRQDCPDCALFAELREWRGVDGAELTLATWRCECGAVMQPRVKLDAATLRAIGRENAAVRPPGAAGEAFRNATTHEQEEQFAHERRASRRGGPDEASGSGSA